MDEHSYTYEAIGPLYSIYVGSGPSGMIAADERNLIVGLCREDFDSFTCANTLGFFKGFEEQSLVFQIATSDKGAVRRLATRIAQAHSQVSVGIGEPCPNGSGLIYGRIKPLDPLPIA